MEQDQPISFLSILISKKPDRKLGDTVNRKPTHMDRNLHKNSNYHPAQKGSLLNWELPRCNAGSVPEQKKISAMVDKEMQKNLPLPITLYKTGTTSYNLRSPQYYRPHPIITLAIGIFKHGNNYNQKD